MMMTAAASPMAAPAPRLSPLTWLNIFTRTLAIQGAWNYETLIGNGIGFCVEPALRALPGGVKGAEFKAAMTRQSGYFNAHPYLASVAVGALARAELSGVPSDRIERFRTALAGPLGSVGDRLVWAGWLPFCSLLALLCFGLGVASALANPVLRRGPEYVARAAAATAGIAVPLTAARLLGHHVALLGTVLGAAVLLAAVLVKLHGRVEGYKLALVLIALFALVSVAR